MCFLFVSAVHRVLRSNAQYGTRKAVNAGVLRVELQVRMSERDETDRLKVRPLNLKLTEL